ncbi:hypothetical protein JD79_00953 [Geodermatophilus normandii]|uniref:Uncharacterized protein n=1 Tax=Geodermatophilus normandii TaxID=1137989 RepID=A0A317QEP8_9ACTN|nr:hypothetical protein JD79_00953 [Geodermatophilus normandii]
MDLLAGLRRPSTGGMRGPILALPAFASPIEGLQPRPSRHCAPSSSMRFIGQRVAEAGRTAPAGKPCTCGHGKVAHSHYRAGTDCSLCSCDRYDRPLMARLRLRR